MQVATCGGSISSGLKTSASLVAKWKSWLIFDYCNSLLAARSDRLVFKFDFPSQEHLQAWV